MTSGRLEESITQELNNVSEQEISNEWIEEVNTENVEALYHVTENAEARLSQALELYREDESGVEEPDLVRAYKLARRAVEAEGRLKQERNCESAGLKSLRNLDTDELGRIEQETDYDPKLGWKQKYEHPGTSIGDRYTSRLLKCLDLLEESYRALSDEKIEDPDLEGRPYRFNP